jgi:hypothetical protein
MGLLWRKLFTESNAAPRQTALWLSTWHDYLNSLCRYAHGIRHMGAARAQRLRLAYGRIAQGLMLGFGIEHRPD